MTIATPHAESDSKLFLSPAQFVGSNTQKNEDEMKETPVNLKSFLVFYCPHITQWYLTHPRTSTAVCECATASANGIPSTSGGSINMNL